MVELQRKLVAHRAKYGTGINPTGAVVNTYWVEEAYQRNWDRGNTLYDLTYRFAELTLPVYVSAELKEGECLLLFDHEYWTVLCQS